MVLGSREGQNFVACDVPALLEHTRDFVYLEEGDLAVLTAGRRSTSTTAQGRAVNRPTRRIDWTPMMAEKGGHKHFMHKEIWEQPRALADTLRGRVLLSEGDVHFEGWTSPPEKVTPAAADHASWPAAPAGTRGWPASAMIEALARIPVDVELASRVPLPRPDRRRRRTWPSPSASRARRLDTLAALKEAKARGARTMALCNVMGSAMTREADFTVLTNAGPGDRRRLHQGLHHPARGAVPAGGEAGPAARARST